MEPASLFASSLVICAAGREGGRDRLVGRCSSRLCLLEIRYLHGPLARLLRKSFPPFSPHNSGEVRMRQLSEKSIDPGSRSKSSWAPRPPVDGYISSAKGSPRTFNNSSTWAHFHAWILMPYFIISLFITFQPSPVARRLHPRGFSRRRR